MVDDMKKQMRRFEHLVGFKGRLDVTSRESMKRLIDALDFRYKNDIQNSIRLHRLEFFYDLVEGRRKRKEKKDQNVKDAARKSKRKKSDEKEEESKKVEMQQEVAETEQVESDEVPSIRATDVDDWKDLMTLSKIYYVLEHPRSEGLKWKRRIAKKKTIRKFSDKDFIEWRVTQNFRLRGLEEWAQRRSDARKLAEQQHFDMEEIESDDDVKEMEQLYEMFDPSGRKYKSKGRTVKPKEKLSTADRPFKFKDESIEDWTESYSDDSDYSDEYFAEETDDFKEETERKLPESEEEKELPPEEAEDIAELFSKYPEFIRYREEIFKRMEKAETTEEWFKLYFESWPTPDEMEITEKEAILPLITVTEDKEESEPESVEEGPKVKKLVKLKEIDTEVESESKIKEKDQIKVNLKYDKTDIEEEMDPDIKSVIEGLIIDTKEDIGGKEQLEFQTGIVGKEQQPETKFVTQKVIQIPEEEVIGKTEQFDLKMKIGEGEEKPETESVIEEMIQILEEGTTGKTEKLDSQIGKGKESETKSAIEEVVKIPEEETIRKAEQLKSQAGIGEHPEPDTKTVVEKMFQKPEEETIRETEQLQFQTGIGEESETKSAIKKVIQNLEEETVEKTEQLESLKRTDEDKKNPEKEITVKETIQKPDKNTGLKKHREDANETAILTTESMPEEESQTLTEPRHQEIEIIEDEEELKFEDVSKEDESDSIKEERMKVYTDDEINEEAADYIKTDDILKGLEQKQEIKNTSDGNEDLLKQDTTLENKEESEGHGMQNLANEGNEIANKNEEFPIEISKQEAEQLTSEREKQENNTYNTESTDNEKIIEIIKKCSAKQHRRKSRIRRSTKYSLFPMEDESAEELSFAVRRSDILETIQLCAGCTSRITSIASQDTDEDETSTSDSDIKTEKDAEDKKETESE